MLCFGNPVGGLEDVNEVDARIVTESILIDALSADEAESLMEDTAYQQDLIHADIVQERTIVKMDKKAKLARGIKAACFTIARRKKDVKFKKLLTIWRIERQLEAYLLKKYRNEATRMAKISLNRKKLPVGNAGAGAHVGAIKKAITGAKTQLNAAAAK